MIGHFICLFAAIVGYLVTAALSLGGTMVLTSTAPGLVVSAHRLRAPYKLAHEGLWFICVLLGSLAAAWCGSLADRREQEVLLLAALLLALWRNTWEARQRGTAHQLLISALTIAAVLAGFALEQRVFPAAG